MSHALTRYRVLAYATGVFLLLLTLNIVLKYLLDQPGLGAWVGIGHGWLYLVYVIVAVDLWFRSRLPATRMLLVVLAGTVPFMSFVAERWVSHRLAGSGASSPDAPPGTVPPSDAAPSSSRGAR
jgi:integral membrane protein